MIREKLQRFVGFVDNGVVTRKSLIALFAVNLLVQFAFFFSVSNFDDLADYSGDSWDYQSIAVNYQNGSDFMVHGGELPFEAYRFRSEPKNLYCITQEEFYERAGDFSTYRNPTYPAFLVVCYKIFGHSPYWVKVVQLVLMVLGASSLLLSGHLLTGNQVVGVLSGLVASWLFMLAFHEQAAQYYAESVLVFLFGILLCSWCYYWKVRSFGSFVIFSVLIALGILSKGLFYFPAIIMLGILIWERFRYKKREHWVKLLALTIVTMLVLGPYVIWQNLRDTRGTDMELTERSVEKLRAIWTEVSTVEQYHHALLSSEDSVLIALANQNGDRILHSEFKEVIKRSKLLVAKWQAAQKPVGLLITRLKSGRFVFVTDQFEDTFLGSHNERTLNGKWSSGWKKDAHSFYRQHYKGRAPVLAAVRFYGNNPKFMLRSMLNKWRNAFLRTEIVSLWLPLVIAVLLFRWTGLIGPISSLIPLTIWLWNFLGGNFLYYRFIHDSTFVVAVIFGIWVLSLLSMLKNDTYRTTLKVIWPFLLSMVLIVFSFYGEPRIILPFYLVYLYLLAMTLVRLAAVTLSRLTLRP